MGMIQPQGILSGPGGEALAKLLAGESTGSSGSMFSGNNMPNLIQALAYANTQNIQGNASMQKAMRDQSAFDLQQRIQEKLLSEGTDDEKTAVTYKRADLDPGVANTLFEKRFKDIEEKAKAEGLNIFTTELRKAYSDGLPPEPAVALVLFRLTQDKESAEKLAKAFGGKATDMQDLGELGRELLINQEEGITLPIMELAMEKISSDTGTNFEALFRNPTLADATMQKYVLQAADEYSKNTTPPPGQTPEGWAEQNRLRALRAYSTFINPVTGKKTTSANPLDRFRMLAEIANATYRVPHQQAQLQLQQEGMEETKRHHRATESIQQTNAKNKHDPNDGWYVDDDPDLASFDANKDGVIKGAERAKYNQNLRNNLETQVGKDTITETEEVLTKNPDGTYGTRTVQKQKSSTSKSTPQANSDWVKKAHQAGWVKGPDGKWRKAK